MNTCAPNRIRAAALQGSAALATLGLLALTGLQPGLAQTYNITDLGTLGGQESSAFGINNLGHIVGSADNGSQYKLKVEDGGTGQCPTAQVSFGKQRPFLWTPTTRNGTTGTITDLGTLGGPSGLAWGINDRGQIVGAANTGTKLSYLGLYDCRYDYYESHPFFWDPSRPNADTGSLTDLAASGFGAFWLAAGGNSPYPFTPIKSSTPPGAVNGLGQVVIEYEQLLWQQGMVTNVGFHARAVNDLGQVVGESYVASNSTDHACLWRNGLKVDLGTLPGDLYSTADGINTNGLVIGLSRDGGSVFKGFVFTLDAGGAVLARISLATPTGLPEFSASIPAGVNNRGQVVGHFGYVYEDYTFGAFLWDNTHGTRDLNTLVPGSGWTLNFANGINDAGQIVGSGVNPSGQSHAFLLTPISAPRLSGTSIQPSGQFRFTLVGEAGRGYTIQASSNLLNWISLTNLVSATATNQFTDTAPSLNRRFYRAVSP